jgi:sterol desaturase/sphingolipid hydroxylase (fatty acid hydroxylase superfamily)
LRARIGAFATPQHHGFHHSRPNDGNYAATYVLWDRLLGTEVTEETPHAQSG